MKPPQFATEYAGIFDNLKGQPPASMKPPQFATEYLRTARHTVSLGVGFNESAAICDGIHWCSPGENYIMRCFNEAAAICDGILHERS